MATETQKNDKGYQTDAELLALRNEQQIIVYVSTLELDLVERRAQVNANANGITIYEHNTKTDRAK